MTLCLFTKDHEWLMVDDDIAIVGITDYAQRQLGDVVFVELPALGAHIKQGEALAVVESVKAASDVYAPISGDVVEVNEAVTDSPGIVNQAPEAGAWFAKIRIVDPNELKQLLSHTQYNDYVSKL